MEEKNLIFLISQPRAGSTLLQLMLSEHPEIATTSEPWIALHPICALREQGMEAPYDASLAVKTLRSFLVQSGVDERFYKKQIASFLLSFYKQAAGDQKKGFFLDKTPRYYHVIEELMEIFPEAKFIILIRNPMAVLNSVLKTWIKGDLTRLVLYYKDLMDAPERLLGALKNHSGRSLKVVYEELVVSPERVLKEICGFVGIPYSVDLLEYSGKRSSGLKFGDPSGVHKTNRPNKGSLDSWKKGFVTPQERFLAMTYLERLGPKLVKEMGYDFDDMASFIEPPQESKRLISWQEIEDDTESRKTLMLDDVRKERDALLNSFSWKITAPLRKISELMSGNKY
ncbi:MAG: sulfotransferase [Thermodesulfobacteriota bacterium]